MYSDTVFSSISLSFSHFTWYYSQIEGIRKTVPQGKPSPTGDLLSPTDLSDFRIYSGNLLPLFNRSFCLLPLFSVIPPLLGSLPRSSDNLSGRWTHHLHCRPPIYTMMVTTSRLGLWCSLTCLLFCAPDLTKQCTSLAGAGTWCTVLGCASTAGVALLVRA